jgi:hypothetical protein
LLQLLTPQPIEPSRFHFFNSTRTDTLARKHKFLAQWSDSIGQSVETGSEYSGGFPLMPPESYNDIGQIYQGPVVLITDALCYSTTDIFAAGFQDHQIGRILGVDANTGAGGANVWEYSLIAKLTGDATFPASLPGQASFRFAVRRVTRVGKNSGVPLEDLGVSPDAPYELTRRDVLERNIDLINHAAAMLKSMDTQILAVTRKADKRFLVSYENISRIDCYLDDRPFWSRPVALSRRRRSSFGFSVPAKARFRGLQSIRLKGYRDGRLVAATRTGITT